MKKLYFEAYNKISKETEKVLLICFINRYVDVLPERNLEGGSQETWMFDDIDLYQYDGHDKKGKTLWLKIQL